MSTTEGIAIPRLSTKLAFPPLRTQAVKRSRLLEALNKGLRLERQLTLVSAPPGFGKTTLVSDWLANILRPATWFTLDESDSDPMMFFQYLVAALREVSPNIGRMTEQLLQTTQLPAIPSLVTPLINDVAAATAFTLVLDDYHVITATPIHDAVRFLIEHQPRPLHLVIITREDPPLPLVRLRVRDQLTEIRERDLCFTLEEAAAFLNETLQLALSLETVEQLNSRTEGWIAGLQLAARALQENYTDVQTFVTEFTGNNRYVVDYLVSEVFDRQPPELRDFLRQTSILNHLTAPLCNAVTGRSDSKSILDQLERANLFLVPLDGSRSYYRYHQLFADGLRLILAREEQIPLHQRATRWFDTQGDGNEAITHALAAASITGIYTEAIQIIHKYIETYINTGRLTTTLTWLNALPDRNVRADPLLLAYKAWALMLKGNAEDAAQYVAAAEDSLSQLPTVEDALGKIRLVQSFLALAHGEFISAAQFAGEALAHLENEQEHWRITALWVMAEAQERNAPITEAITLLREATAIGHKVGKPIFAAVLDASLSGALDVNGRRWEALSICQKALSRFTDDHKQLMPVAIPILTRLIFLYYEANELAQALNCHQQLQALVQQSALDTMWSVLHALQAMLLMAQGELEAALSHVQDALQQVRQTDISDSTWITALQGEVHLRKGNLAAAQHWAKAAGVKDASLEYLHIEQHLTYARLLLAQGAFAEAKLWLKQLEQFTQARGYQRWLISVHILQALCADRMHDTHQARVYLSEAVQIAAPENYQRLFLDEQPVLTLLPSVRAYAPSFVDAILNSAHTTQAQLTPMVLAEAPTDREIEVLRLIVAGLSNAEIAERLVISVATVKQHINRLYSKLDVHSRTQAVAKAHELGLVGET